MPKELLQLSAQSRNQLERLPEAGMGYFLASARLPGDPAERGVIVGGNAFVVPIEVHPKYFSLVDLLSGEPFPTGDPEVQTVALTVPAVRGAATLPNGYLPAPGAVSLLGSIVLASKTRFYRYTGTATDYRFTGGRLAVDTYLTTEADQEYANTGFAAVGRYALPIPVPASHVHVYDLPACTRLLVGTVLPNFGQAGGGVEVKTLAGPGGAGPTATRDAVLSTSIADY